MVLQCRNMAHGLMMPQKLCHCEMLRRRLPGNEKFDLPCGICGIEMCFSLSVSLLHNPYLCHQPFTFTLDCRSCNARSIQRRYFYPSCCYLDSCLSLPSVKFSQYIACQCFIYLLPTKTVRFGCSVSIHL